MGARRAARRAQEPEPDLSAAAALLHLDERAHLPAADDVRRRWRPWLQLPPWRRSRAAAARARDLAGVDRLRRVRRAHMAGRSTSRPDAELRS